MEMEIVHNSTFPIYFRLHLLFFDFEVAIESEKNSNILTPKSFLWKLILKYLQEYPLKFKKNWNRCEVSKTKKICSNYFSRNYMFLNL